MDRIHLYRDDGNKKSFRIYYHHQCRLNPTQFPFNPGAVCPSSPRDPLDIRVTSMQKDRAR